MKGELCRDSADWWMTKMEDRWNGLGVISVAVDVAVEVESKARGKGATE